MSVIRLERIKSDKPLYQALNDTCDRCSGCGIVKRTIELPHPGDKLTGIEMSMHNQWRMLVNSWLKPLILLVLASVICSVSKLPPVFEISLLLTAFATGFFLCREVPAAALSFTDESHTEEVYE